MIDNTLRLRAIGEAAADPGWASCCWTSCSGRGPIPIRPLSWCPRCRGARRASVAVVVSLCGTAGDAQGLERQARAFAEAGAWVYLSNAEAAEAAGRLAQR